MTTIRYINWWWCRLNLLMVIVDRFCDPIGVIDVDRYGDDVVYPFRCRAVVVTIVTATLVPFNCCIDIVDLFSGCLDVTVVNCEHLLPGCYRALTLTFWWAFVCCLVPDVEALLLPRPERTLLGCDYRYSLFLALPAVATFGARLTPGVEQYWWTSEPCQLVNYYLELLNDAPRLPV